MNRDDEISPARPADLQAAVMKASGSSFYAAMRLMRKTEREAMFAIYAFCRAVDDIADDDRGTRDKRFAALDEWRNGIDALHRDEATPLVEFLRQPVARYKLRKEDFLAVIDGMQMDVAEDIRAPTLAVLDLYCDRVASAVGRLSVKVFGMHEEPGFRLAHHLGRALQLTNIVRDIDEDAGVGRLYMPKEFLDQAGIRTTEPTEAILDRRIDTTCRSVAALAHSHYDESRRILESHPAGHLRPPRLMYAVYSNLLRKMERAGWAPPRTRPQIGKGELAMILVRHGIRG